MTVSGGVAEVCRLFVLLVFVLSVVGKLRRFAPFRQAVTALAPVPAALVSPVAASIILAEGVTSLLLLMRGAWSRVGAALAAAMLVAFTLTLAIALARGSSAKCSCFGAGQHEISAHDLGRNALLMGACAYVLLTPDVGGANASLTLLLLGVAVIGVVLSLHLREVIELIMPARLG